jgi:hypothetical protein
VKLNIFDSKRLMLLGVILGLMTVTKTGICGAMGAEPVSIHPTSRLYTADQKIVGFNSNEAGVYFVISSGWTLSSSSGEKHISVIKNQDTYELRFVLSPEFSQALPVVSEIKLKNPKALFFPLLGKVQSASLFFPEIMGNALAHLVPEKDAQPLTSLYYRIRLTEQQLSAFRTLAHGGVTLQGSVDTLISTQSEEISTTVPILLQLKPQDIPDFKPADSDPFLWISDLLGSNQVIIQGALDGSYNLGGPIQLHIRESKLRGDLIPGSFQLEKQRPDQLSVVAIRQPNFLANINFVVEELGVPLSLHAELTIEMSLNLNLMKIELTQITVQNVYTEGGELGSFYKKLLTGLVQRPDIKRLISDALTSEFQRRILSNTLFGLEGVL